MLTADRYRCTCSSDRAVCAFTSAAEAPLLRGLRRCTCAHFDSIHGHALLALQQLPYLMGISLVYCCNLALFLLGTPLLPELDKPLAYVFACWRGSGSDNLA
jgi:hypothetical protein